MGSRKQKCLHTPESQDTFGAFSVSGGRVRCDGGQPRRVRPGQTPGSLSRLCARAKSLPGLLSAGCLPALPTLGSCNLCARVLCHQKHARRGAVVWRTSARCDKPGVKGESGSVRLCASLGALRRLVLPVYYGRTGLSPPVPRCGRPFFACFFHAHPSPCSPNRPSGLTLPCHRRARLHPPGSRTRRQPGNLLRLR